jgi:hypothetical protein
LVIKKENRPYLSVYCFSRKYSVAKENEEKE